MHQGKSIIKTPPNKREYQHLPSLLGGQRPPATMTEPLTLIFVLIYLVSALHCLFAFCLTFDLKKKNFPVAGQVTRPHDFCADSAGIFMHCQRYFTVLCVYLFWSLSKRHLFASLSILVSLEIYCKCYIKTGAIKSATNSYTVSL